MKTCKVCNGKLFKKELCRRCYSLVKWGTDSQEKLRGYSDNQIIKLYELRSKKGKRKKDTIQKFGILYKKMKEEPFSFTF